MAQYNDQTELVGTFKSVWGENILELFKYAAPLTNAIPFESAQLVGGVYHQAVDLAFEHGFVYAAADTAPGSISLATPVAGKVGDAQVTGSQFYGRSHVAYESIMRSQTDRQAVKEATKIVVRRLGLSAAKRIELQLLHGQRGLGTISSIAAEAGSYYRIVTFTDESWSAGIWAGAEGALCWAYASDLTTQRNSGNPATVSEVDMSAKTVKFTYTGTGEISAWAATDVIFFKTANGSTEFAGIDKISRNTGTLQNISATTYALWGGNIYSTSTGTPSLAKLLDAMAGPASFGLMGQKAVAVVSPKAFEVLNSDQSALRQYGAGYKPANAENGMEGLTFHCQTGTLEVMPHALQKDGLIHIIVPEEMRRIGASDASFIDRGGPQPRLILEAASNPASEMRIQSHQALFVECPRHTVVLAGVTF